MSEPKPGSTEWYNLQAKKINESVGDFPPLEKTPESEDKDHVAEKNEENSEAVISEVETSKTEEKKKKWLKEKLREIFDAKKDNPKNKSETIEEEGVRKAKEYREKIEERVQNKYGKFMHVNEDGTLPEGNISPEMFKELSDGQILLLEQRLDGQRASYAKQIAREKYIDDAEAAKTAGLWKKIKTQVGKHGIIAKYEEEALKDTENAVDVSLTFDTIKNKEVLVRDGKPEINYNAILGVSSDYPDFLNTANKLANMSYDATVDTSSKREHETFKRLEKKFEMEKHEMLETLKEYYSENEAMERMRQVENEIEMDRVLDGNQLLARKINSTIHSSTWIKSIGGWARDNKMGYAAMGAGVRAGLKATAVMGGLTATGASLLAAPLIGLGVGYLRGKAKAQDTLSDDLKLVRNSDKKQKGLVNDGATDGRRDLFTSVDQQKSRMESLIGKINKTGNFTENLSLRNQLKNRLDFAREKLESGHMSFGKGKEAFANKYEFYKILDEAAVTLALNDEEAQEKFNENIERIFGYDTDKNPEENSADARYQVRVNNLQNTTSEHEKVISLREKDYVIRQAKRSAKTAALFGLGGAAVTSAAIHIAENIPAFGHMKDWIAGLGGKAETTETTKIIDKESVAGGSTVPKGWSQEKPDWAKEPVRPDYNPKLRSDEDVRNELLGSLALVQKGDGVTNPLARQIEEMLKNPEQAKSLGFDGKNPHKFALKKAAELAKEYGYIKPDGSEVRLGANSIDHASYEVKMFDGKLAVNETFDGKDMTEGNIDKEYEYSYKKEPKVSTPSEEEIVKVPTNKSNIKPDFKFLQDKNNPEWIEANKPTIDGETKLAQDIIKDKNNHLGQELQKYHDYVKAETGKDIAVKSDDTPETYKKSLDEALKSSGKKIPTETIENIKTKNPDKITNIEKPIIKSTELIKQEDIDLYKEQYENGFGEKIHKELSYFIREGAIDNLRTLKNVKQENIDDTYNNIVDNMFSVYKPIGSAVNKEDILEVRSMQSTRIGFVKYLKLKKEINPLYKIFNEEKAINILSNKKYSYLVQNITDIRKYISLSEGVDDIPPNNNETCSQYVKRLVDQLATKSGKELDDLEFIRKKFEEEFK